MRFRARKVRGAWMIEGERVCYVGGRLKMAWQEAFQAFGLEGRPWERVLLVGMGASLMQILASTATPPLPQVTVLEKYAEMVALQEAHCALPLAYEVVLGDAAETIHQLYGEYSGIFVDAFEEESIPETLLSQRFVDTAVSLLAREGLIFWNVLLPAQARWVGERLSERLAEVRRWRWPPHTIWAGARFPEAFPTPA